MTVNLRLQRRSELLIIGSDAVGLKFETVHPVGASLPNIHKRERR